ncbi:hypothetical protein AAZX31_08G341100 [Glycine max]
MHEMSPMVDRISSLPDTLLCHILSFLPTKEAIATTSLLSKRWSPLWLSVSTLRFNDQCYLQNKDNYFRFLQLVYTVMLSRDVAQPIQRFYLACMSSLCDTSMVNTWVTTVIQRKVQRLELSLPSTINLPCCILTSTTLVVLKLSGLTVNRVSSSPVDLPSLKALHLRRVHFLELRWLLQILSACPLLEDLLIRSLHVTNFSSDEQLKRLPKLVRADISDSFIYIPLTGFYHVEFLRTEVAWNLFFDKNHTFFNLSYLELKFICQFHDWDWLIKLLHQCPNLQILVIDKENGFTKTSVDENWVYPRFVPKGLSSKLKRCCVRNYEGQEGELQFARYIMQNARVLGALTICSTTSSNPEAKLQMIKKLSTCPRISVTCELSFE